MIKKIKKLREETNKPMKNKINQDQKNKREDKTAKGLRDIVSIYKKIKRMKKNNGLTYFNLKN